MADARAYSSLWGAGGEGGMQHSLGQTSCEDYSVTSRRNDPKLAQVWSSPATLVEEIVEQATKYSNIIVITGGEPLMWNMEPLTLALKKKKMQIHIETSGAYEITGHWDWFCLSPKKNKLPTLEAYSQADELKVIIYNNDDFRFAEQQAKKVKENCLLYLQPEWGKRDKVMPLIVEYVLQNPSWKASLQTHKYLNIP